MRVYLTGFMGAGKTTVGRELADRLGWPFADLDAGIEERSGLAVGEIFERFGEEHFRRLEREALVRTAELTRGVVATGGGTPIDSENRSWMRDQGRVVWLDVAFDVVVSRLRGDASRPLFSDVEAVRRLFDLRRPAYAECHLAVPVASRSAGEVAAAIADGLAIPGSRKPAT